MAKKLSGKLKLSKLPKQLIKVDEQTGEKYIWIDVVERKTPSPYGATHSLQVWDKETGTVYLADLKPREFGSDAQPAAQPAVKKVEEEDLPF